MRVTGELEVINYYRYRLMHMSAVKVDDGSAVNAYNHPLTGLSGKRSTRNDGTLQVSLHINRPYYRSCSSVSVYCLFFFSASL